MFLLRQATKTDYAFLYALHTTTMKEYVTQMWSWDETIQQEMFRDTFDPERSHIVEIDGGDVGVLSIEQHPGVLFLANPQILPKEQGRGLGTAIIGTLLAQASDLGISVMLQVLKVNPARRLYEGLGFVIVGETITHYLISVIPPCSPDTSLNELRPTGN